jgi:hypothetical protein
MPPRGPRRARDPVKSVEVPIVPHVDHQDIDMPDDLRRRDQPDTVSPAPRSDEELVPGGRSPLPDGGVDEHPVHDEPMEDFGPDDYEHLTDEAEVRLSRELGLKEETDDEDIDEDSDEEGDRRRRR